MLRIMPDRLSGRMPDAPLTQRIACRVRAIRMERGWSPAELSRRSRVGKTTLSRIEAAQIEPSAGTVENLALALGVKVDALFREPSEDQVEDAIEALLERIFKDPATARDRMRAVLRGLAANQGSGRPQ